MGKQSKVLHGSCSEAFINGQRVSLMTKIEVKVTGDFEDATVRATPFKRTVFLAGDVQILGSMGNLEFGITLV